MDKKDYINIQKSIDGILDNGARIEFIHGMLTAVLCAPEIIPPSDWLPLLLHKDGKDFEFESMDEANRLIGSLMELYNDISKSLADDRFYPLYNHRKAPGKGKLGADPETAWLWCRGFVGGLGLWRTDFAAEEKARELLMPVFPLVDNNAILEDNPEISAGTIKQLEKNSVSVIPESVAILREYYLLKSKTVNACIGRNEPVRAEAEKNIKRAAAWRELTEYQDMIKKYYNPGNYIAVCRRREYPECVDTAELETTEDFWLVHALQEVKYV